MNSPKFALSAMLALALSPSAAFAGSVDISGLVNADIQTYNNGSNYPLGGSTVNIGGVSFTLAAINGGGTGVIQTSGNDSFTINVDQVGVSTVYTLINSAWGAVGTNNGSLVFTDAASDTYTYNLVEGTNVRDHYNGSFVNTATDLYGTASFSGGVRLDAQQIVLPTAFASSTLTTITFNGINAVYPTGAPFLAAVTTSVPEPSTWTMLMLGVGLAGAGLRRRARAAVAVVLNHP